MSGVCDVIIVLGAAVWPGGQPSPALRRRVTHAVHLLQSEKGRRLLVTGGLGKHAPAEADVMRQLAIDAGVPPSLILVEDQATSTFEQVVGVAERKGQSETVVRIEELFRGDTNVD